MLEGMSRRRVLSRLLWSVAGASSLIACGRLGFEQLGAEVTHVTELALTSTCGQPAAPSLLIITNDRDTPLVIHAAAATGGFGVTTPLPLTISPGADGELAIVPPLAVIGTDRSGTIKTGVLSLSTDEPATPTRTIDLRTTVMGAELEIRDGLGQPVDLTFSAAGTCPPATAMFLHNVGSLPMSVDIATPSRFALSSSSASIDAGSSAYIDVRPYTTASCVGSEVLSYTVTGEVCATTPAVLQAAFDITGLGTCACS